MDWAARAGASILLGLVIAGCGPSSWTGRSGAVRNSDCVKAREAVENRDFELALELYERALAANPALAEAHLEVGLLHEDKKKDPVTAIYHYRQYLKLRPHSGKQQVVEDFIERAKVSLLTSLPQSAQLDADVASRLQAENANLAQENAMLHARVTELEKAFEDRAAAEVLRSAMAEPPGVAPLAQAVPAQMPQPSEPAVGMRTHLVQKGDTLYSLAQRYYGNRTDWQKIFQANRHALVSKDQLKVGQQLVIP